MGTRGDARRFAHEVKLGARFEEPHVVQHMLERDDLVRRVAALAHLGAQAVDPTDQALVEFRVHAHRVIHGGAALDETRQDVVRTVLTCRPFGASAAAIPGLPRRIAIAHKEDVFGGLTPGHQNRDRLGLAKPGEIEEVAVLAVGVLDIVVAHLHRRCRHDGDGVATHDAGELPPAACEFVLGYGFTPLRCHGSCVLPL